MTKAKRVLSIIVILALLVGSSAPFMTQLAAASDGEDEPEVVTPCEASRAETKAEPMEEVEPEEDTSGVVSTGPVHMVLEDLVLISRAEPAKETVPLSPGWQNIMTDGFEGAFPGVWSIYVGVVDAYWGWDNTNPHTGSYSAFCAKYGTESVIPGENYPNDMATRMDYGPFSLADATDAMVDYYMWLDAESGYDALWYLASIDGVNWYGNGWTGYSGDWVAESFDLTNVEGLGDLCGESSVWITFVFTSDESNLEDYYGAFIDDVVLQKDTSAAEFDLEAVEAYLSTQAGDTEKNYLVDVPTVGQDVYFHFKWNCIGSGTTPSFHLDINLDAVPFCGGDTTADGGSSYTTWCVSPWTATAGSHTLTSVLDVYDDVSESNEANNEASKNWDTPLEAGWTFMVYSDGDNDLEGSELTSFNYMELAANNANVNIVVQIDRIPGYDTSNGDWTTTRRYKVKYDTDMVNFASYTEGIDYWDLGELNMADPNTLIDFVQWAKTNYPADHYCLVPSNHGGGWKPRGGGQLVPRGILWDYTDGDYMSTAELGDALNSATSGGTEKLDVLFLDACLMQMIEVGYEVRDYSQYLVTSEYISWGPGPYHAYISSITSTTTAPQLATTIVNEYHSWLTGTIYAHTMSAVDLAQFGLASVVDDFAQELTTGLSTYQTEIENSRSACQKFYDDSYIDLYHFAFLIDQNIADATIQNAAQAVMTAVNNAVIAEAHENGGAGNYYPLDNANGISIYFPAEGDYDPSNYNSSNLAFAADKGWDEFLAAFFTVNNPPNAPASPLCEGVTNPTGVTDPTPEFSWTFSDPDGGDTQGAYQILVASTSENLTSDNGDMWDSGKVSSSASEVSYAGTALAENQTYYWKVKTWDNNDAEGTYCGEQQFATVTSPSEVWVDDSWAGSIHSASVGGHTFGTDAFDNIQDGIDAVSSSTVHVAAGTYYENITLKDGVEVLGAGADVTTIDGGGSGSVVTADSVNPATKLDGFTITNGSATDGGGIYLYYSSPTLTNCTFSANSATWGGGMYNYNSSPTVTNCTFSGNSAGMEGGGMRNSGSSPTVTNCTFLGNSATGGSKAGGGMYNTGSSPTVTNCTFSGNSAGYGGGLCNNASSPTLTNCTFSGNSASGQGGGMYNYNNSSPTVTNCILWGNGQEIYDADASTPVVTYCDIQGGYSGAGNIDADPMFVNPATDDYHLQPSSPCIDVGDDTAVPGWLTTDFEGDPRIVDGDGDTVAVVDMGADEYVVAEWSVPMTANTDTEGSNPNLEFGVRAGATDGYDSSIDVAHPPPILPLDAYFLIVHPTFPKLDKDYRAPADSIQWTLHAESSSEDITLTWDTTGIPSELSAYMDTGISVINMKAQNNVVLPAGEYTITISVSTEVEIQISLQAGWNMVSVPVTPQDTSIASVFAGAEVVYTWNPITKSYYLPTEVEPNKGYFVAVLSNTVISVWGVPVYNWTCDVTAGWNMSGSVFDDVSFTDPQDSPDGSVEAFGYWWDPVTKSYVFTTTIEAKKGYWIAATQNCTLTLSTP